MALIGYARVSSVDQDLGVQVDALHAAGCERIFKEKQSGRTADDRPVWQECLEFLREGDVLVFTRLDRIGRSVIDLVTIGRQLEERGVEVKCLLQPLDTTTPEGRLLWGVLATVAEFEVDLKRERQREGIDRAKAEGRYKGGAKKRKVTADLVRKLRDEDGLGASAIARELRCDRTTVYRALPDGWGPAPRGG